MRCRATDPSAPGGAATDQSAIARADDIGDELRGRLCVDLGALDLVCQPESAARPALPTPQSGLDGYIPRRSDEGGGEPGAQPVAEISGLIDADDHTLTVPSRRRSVHAQLAPGQRPPQWRSSCLPPKCRRWRCQRRAEVRFGALVIFGLTPNGSGADDTSMAYSVTRNSRF